MICNYSCFSIMPWFYSTMRDIVFHINSWFCKFVTSLYLGNIDSDFFFTSAKFGSTMLWKLTKLKCKTVFIILPLLLKLYETWWNLVKLSETFSWNFPWKLHVFSKTVKLPYYSGSPPKMSTPFLTGWGGGGEKKLLQICWKLWSK